MGMVQHEVTRTLVKSQPELWAQCSEAESLERHLSRSFGEIRITRLEPEHSVAWEGEQVRGTVKIEPSAWGTRVTMAVQLEEEASGDGGIPSAEPAHPDGAAAPVEPAHPNGAAAPVEAVEPDEAPAASEPVTVPPVSEAPSSAPPPAEEPVAPPSPIAEPSTRRLGRWWSRFLRPSAGVVARPEASIAPEPVDIAPVLDTPEPPEPAPPEPIAPEAAAPESVQPGSPEPASPPTIAEPPRADAEAVLTAALESLGQAHHRPYSRA